MVAEITPGEDVIGILYYNERKVATGKADIINAVGFGCDVSELTLAEKRNRLNDLVSRNRIAKVNAIHIWISFDPSENIEKNLLNEIADVYMEKIGFGNQPYLVYKHNDTATTHMHICTTNIQEDGHRIPLDFIGVNKSKPACTSIEEMYNLVRAEGKKKDDKPFILKPADLVAVKYGEKATKDAISNIVRSVYHHYKYGSFTEFKTALRLFNVLADRGNSDSVKFRKGGLTYSVVDENGAPTGVPIKASSIYDKPVLKNIEKRIPKNIASRKAYGERLARTIDLILEGDVSQSSFKKKMKAEGVDVVFWRNEDGHVYGVTYIDHVTAAIFNGSDLKGYSASAILSRTIDLENSEVRSNHNLAKRLIEKTKYEEGIRSILTKWAMEQLVVVAKSSGRGKNNYYLGKLGTDIQHFVPANKHLASYFSANHLTVETSKALIEALSIYYTAKGGFSIVEFLPQSNPMADRLYSDLSSIVDIAMSTVYTENHVPSALLNEQRRKKKKRRRY